MIASGRARARRPRSGPDRAPRTAMLPFTGWTPLSQRARDPGLAVALGLLSPGLGLAYSGRVGAGVAVLGMWILFLAGFGAGLRRGPGPGLVAGASVVLLWLVQAIWGGVAERRAREVPRSGLSRPAGLVLYCLAALAVVAASRPVLNAFVLQTYLLPTGSMLPTLEVGDVIVAIPGAKVERGAIVVHAAPRSGRSREPVVKRVVGVAGDTVQLQDGRLLLNGAAVPGERLPGSCTYATMRAGTGWLEEPCRAATETLGPTTYRVVCSPDAPCGDFGPLLVPEGHVFVLGDHRDSSADSRHHGPIPASSILGRARWIAWSWGPEGVRRERLGIELR